MHRSGGAVEMCVPVGEDAAVGREEPVAGTGRGRGERDRRLVERPLAAIAVEHRVTEMSDAAARARDVIALRRDASQRQRHERRRCRVADAERRDPHSVCLWSEDRLDLTLRLGCERRRAAVREAVGAHHEVGGVAAVKRNLLDRDRLGTGVHDGRDLVSEVRARAPLAESELASIALQCSRRRGCRARE